MSFKDFVRNGDSVCESWRVPRAWDTITYRGSYEELEESALRRT
jgi:hypothetical protein